MILVILVRSIICTVAKFQLTSSAKSSSSCVDSAPQLTKKYLNLWIWGGRFSLLRYMRISPFTGWAHPKSSRMESAWFFQLGSCLIQWYTQCHTIIFLHNYSVPELFENRLTNRLRILKSKTQMIQWTKTVAFWPRPLCAILTCCHRPCWVNIYLCRQGSLPTPERIRSWGLCFLSINSSFRCLQRHLIDW